MSRRSQVERKVSPQAKNNQSRAAPRISHRVLLSGKRNRQVRQPPQNHRAQHYCWAFFCFRGCRRAAIIGSPARLAWPTQIKALTRRKGGTTHTLVSSPAGAAWPASPHRGGLSFTRSPDLIGDERLECADNQCLRRVTSANG